MENDWLHEFQKYIKFFVITIVILVVISIVILIVS